MDNFTLNESNKIYCPIGEDFRYLPNLPLEIIVTNLGISDLQHLFKADPRLNYDLGRLVNGIKPQLWRLQEYFYEIFRVPAGGAVAFTRNSVNETLFSIPVALLPMTPMELILHQQVVVVDVKYFFTDTAYSVIQHILGQRRVSLHPKDHKILVLDNGAQPDVTKYRRIVRITRYNKEEATELPNLSLFRDELSSARLIRDQKPQFINQVNAP